MCEFNPPAPPAQRHLIVISGTPANCQQLAQQLSAHLDSLWLDKPQTAHQYLGQEFDAVIFQTFNEDGKEQFDANALGAISGTIRAGGYLLLLKNTDGTGHSLFLSRFERILADFPELRVIDASQAQMLSPLPLPEPYKTQSTQDQQDAVKAILAVVKGHRRRPLLLTADRGRGKSAALGLAAAKLYQQGYRNIIVCAPSKKMAAMVFQYAGDAREALKFYSPDELQQQKPVAELLLVDEAAAIPLPLLSDFARHYSRIVFASTLHGYEGSGRGFALAFTKILDQVAPQWKSQVLQTPIRWGQDDYLEAFIFKALLLNAEAASSASVKHATPDNCKFEQLGKQQLLNDEALLNEVFGLLVTAHYQTRPSDFRQMLDDQNMQIFVLRDQAHKQQNRQQHIIGVCLLVAEGNIEQALAEAVFQGKRRIRGHLVAQALAANVGIAAAPCLTAQRIIRIAIHPDKQGQGFGSLLLQRVQDCLKPDYFSSSFGASVPLLNFWKKAGFKPVYLSMKRDASSATHSVIMLKGKTRKGKQMQSTAQHYFADSFPHLLSDPFRDLDYEIALALLRLLQPATRLPPANHEIRLLKAFTTGQRGYENTFYPIWKLVLDQFVQATEIARIDELKPHEKQLIILKVLQKQNWKSCVAKLEGKIKGKKDALLLLRQSLFKLLSD